MKLNEEPINIFDFDGTLTTETWPKFWVWVKKFGYNGEQRNDELEKALTEYRKTHNGDNLETFFGFFNDLLVTSSEKITYDELMEGEKYIVYNPGVTDFIKNTTVKNYIVSGGLKYFLQNLKIAQFFSDIYGTSIKQDDKGLLLGIDEIMTDDMKIFAIKEILRRNNRQENDCQNVFYIGDGYSDATAMRFVHNNGGKSIFVHQPNQDDELFKSNNEVYNKLEDEGIIDYCFEADYKSGSNLANILLRKK